MTNNAIQALMAIAAFPITDPKNMDAINIRQIAVSALSGLKKEILAIEKENKSEFKTKVEKGVLKVMIDTLGFDKNDIKLESRLKEDLGLDDLDLIELHMRLEGSFGLEIEDSVAEVFKTPKEIVEFINSKQR